jgi:hypothetical protein
MRKKEGLVQAHLDFEAQMVLGNVTQDLDGRETRATCNRRAFECAEAFSLRKEVIQPQVLLRLPCYDFTPIMNYTLGGCSLAVSAPTSSATHFRDVTGGVYKARERIHRGMLIHDY